MGKYNKRTVDIICKSLEGMNSKTVSAKSAGISSVTFFEWYNTKPEFKQRIDETLNEVQDLGRSIAVNTIFKAMQDNQWTAAAWWLERTLPNEFGKRDRYDIDVTEKKIIFKIGIGEDEDDNTNISISNPDKKQIENE